MEGSGNAPVIYIYAPAYIDKSNGIKIMYSLGTLINETRKFRAKILCYERPRNDFGKFSGCEVIYTCYKKVQIRDFDIVIYPETISGNPAGARRIVRYLMNKPYFLTGAGVDYGSEDLIISYSNGIDATLEVLFIMHDERELYRREQKEKKNKAIIYFGKVDPANLDKQYPLVRNLLQSFDTVEYITRLHPPQKTDLLDMIGESRLMISFDPLSNLNYEATLCGTPVLLLNDAYNLLDGSFNLPMYGVFSSLEGYDQAMLDVSLSFIDYCRKLDEQLLHVTDFCEAAMKHFEKIATDPGYAAVVQKKSTFQKIIDKKKYLERTNSNLVNIDHLQQIPTCYRQLLSISEQKQTNSDVESCESELGKPFHSKLYLTIKRNIIGPSGMEGVFTIMFRLRGETLKRRLCLAKERFDRNIAGFKSGKAVDVD